MFRIGHFSRIAQVSIKTLRHYDEIGLLKPNHVDSETGYRLYAADQLARLHRILAMREMGLSLEQIGRALDHLAPTRLREMLDQQRLALSQRIREEEDRLSRVEARLNLMERRKDNMPEYETVIKDIPPVTVAGIRRTVPTYADVGALFAELAIRVGMAETAGPPLAIWHDEGYRERDVDGEALWPLKKPIPSQDGITVYELAGGLVAATVHHGTYATLTDAYTATLHGLGKTG